MNSITIAESCISSLDKCECVCVQPICASYVHDLGRDRSRTCVNTSSLSLSITVRSYILCPLIIVLYACQMPTASLFFFFFNDTATTEIYTLSLHDALPI